ncbi:MAG: TetR/AcrR family transcriptional regulator [bacterium]
MPPTHLASRKARTRRSMIENAIALFREKGVRAARAAEIAEASGVSTATLFNYFSNRSLLAEAWVREELMGTLAAPWIGKAAPPGLWAGLRRACRELARISAPYPETRLEAWRSVGRASPPQDLRAGELRAPLEARVVLEQDAQRLRGDLPAREITALLVDAVEGALVGELERVAGSGRAVDEKALDGALRARVDLVLDGARKRNERVRAPGTPTRPGPGTTPRAEAR